MTASATAMADQGLFDSAHAALVFAFNYSGQYYDRPMINRLAAPGAGSGNGLVGLDGAAQAGMIRSEVQALGKLSEAIIIARIAPRTVPCHCRSACCAGHRPNKEWTNAISFLADYVRTTALAGCTANGLLRREYVVRHFTRKDDRISLDELARRHGIHRDTASAHASKVAQLFGGSRPKNGRPGAAGLEAAAMDAIEARLLAIGVIGD